MASGNQRAEVRRAAALQADDETYTNEQLDAMIDGELTLNRVILKIWREKAAAYAEMVTVSEAGSSRSLSELHGNALEMIKVYQQLVDADDAASTGGGSGRPFSVPITRV